jgi:hypothetical protein
MLKECTLTNAQRVYTYPQVVNAQRVYTYPQVVNAEFDVTIAPMLAMLVLLTHPACGGGVRRGREERA